MDQELVRQIVTFFSPTELHLSDFRDSVKTLHKRCRDVHLRQIAKKLLVVKGGVNGWMETGGTLLLLAEECGLDSEQIAASNMYLKLLLRKSTETDGRRQMSDEEYKDVISRRMAEVTNSEPRF